MPIITLSRKLASGGEAIALTVAQDLGLRVVDRHVIDQAAVEVGVPRVALEELGFEGRRSNMAKRILSIVYGMPAIPTTLDPDSAARSATLNLFGSFLSPLQQPMSLSMREYVRVVGVVIRNLAHDGNVIVVGRGGQAVLRGVPGVLHVQIIASFEQRLNTLMRWEEIERREARLRLRDSDLARADYLRRYYDVNWLDESLYDLIINTDNHPLSIAVAAVEGAYRALDTQMIETEDESEGECCTRRVQAAQESG